LTFKYLAVKKSFKIICTLIIGLLSLYSVSAQDKKAALMAAVNNRNFIFIANYVSPARGGGHALTSDYDVTLTKDSVITYLPYFGRAYMANYGSLDDGIKLTTTKFSYTQTTNKKGNVEILITPKEQNLTDALAVKSMRLNISPDGYASLQVISFNRDPIIFNGNIEERKGKGI
jgi:hypothetical protein